MASKLRFKTTREAFEFAVTLARVFAMFPTWDREKPKLKIFQFTYGLSYLTLLAINIAFYVVKIAGELKFGYFVSLLFFTCSFVTTTIFLGIAKSWNRLMGFWTEVDLKMQNRNYGFPRNLQKKLVIITCCVITAAILEHAFFVCFASSNISSHGTAALDEFLRSMNSHVFSYVPYNFPFGIVFELSSVFSTFTWNYMDLFVMLISLALAERFRQVARKISRSATLKFSDLFTWREIRKDYNRLSVLCKKIDDTIDDLILLSFANNVFVILVQLVNTLELLPKTKNDVIGRLYFVYSFGFLILRTLFVCLFASRIYEESKSAILDLNSLPTYLYNIEIDRLLVQLKLDECCLSGRKLFYVKKSLILSIAGAIVTYELILIQFNINY